MTQEEADATKLDAELRRAELQETKAARESEDARHAAELAFRAKELEAAGGRGLQLSTAQATVAAGLLALISGVVGGAIQALTTRDVESGKNAALVKIEEVKANAGVALEQQKQKAAERLDRVKFETTLILKATESPDRDEQVRNLKFFLNAGFITDPEGKIARIDERQYPSAPPPAESDRLRAAANLRAVSDLPSSSPLRVEARAIGSVRIQGHMACTGWLVDGSHVVTAAYCVTEARTRNQALEFQLGHLSDKEIGDIYKVARIVSVDEKLGHAVLEVDPAAGRKYGHLRGGLRLPEPGEPIRIFQYSQSPGQRISDADCMVTAVHISGKAIPGASEGAGFAYRCASGGGSGGAPVISAKDGAVLGVHLAASDKLGFGVALKDLLQRDARLAEIVAKSGKP